MYVCAYVCLYVLLRSYSKKKYHLWIDSNRKKSYSAQRKTCASATLSAENFISLGSNAGLWNERPMTLPEPWHIRLYLSLYSVRFCPDVF